MASAYELIRLKNIEHNKKVLEELGLLNVRNTIFKGLAKPKVQKPFKPKIVKKAIVSSVVNNGFLESVDDVDVPSLTSETRRRSTRLSKSRRPNYKEMHVELKDEEEEKPAPRLIFPKNRENVFGAIPGVEIGTIYNTRMEFSYVGIHRPTVAGIHGNEAEGCYSLALSGGYEDDIDMGYAFTYTGEGGRDLKGTKANPKNLRTAPQSKDQTLTRGNMALSRNVEKRRPVRVIRGYKLKSPYAPEEGYRYDGLYYVEKYWLTEGLSGFMVYKFALKRCENQPPPPWEME